MVYLLKLIALVIVTVPAAVMTILIGLFDLDGKCVYGISRLWSRAILRICGISVSVRGSGRIDRRQHYVFIANHQSNLDIPILIDALPAFQLRWVAKRELLWVPLFGWAMWAAKHVTVNRSNRSQARQSLKQAEKRIERGISLVFFPEGTRSPDGRLLPFKRGGFWVAAQTKTPLVPITIDGSAALLPKGDWRVRRGEIQLTINEAVSVTKEDARDLAALSRRVRGAIGAALDAGSSVSRCQDDALPILTKNPCADNE